MATDHLRNKATRHALKVYKFSLLKDETKNFSEVPGVGENDYIIVVFKPE